MVSVTSASRYVTSASRYQSRFSIDIRGLIPRNSTELADDQAYALWMLGNCLCCRLLTFFKLTFLKKKLSRTQSACQMLWVQTVCKGYQQTTKDEASKDSQTNRSYYMFDIIAAEIFRSQMKDGLNLWLSDKLSSLETVLYFIFLATKGDSM